MKIEEGFLSVKDETQIYYRCHIQQSNVLVILIHGYGDYSARYDDLIQRLKDLPISWFAFDLRGQGRSGGERVYADSFDVFVKDLEEVRRFAVKRFPEKSKKIILFGHSLGGLIAVKYLSQYQGEFKALALSSPCFQTAGISWSAPVQWFGAVLNCVMPRLVLTNFVLPKYLFRNEEKMEQYKKDSLIERRVSARLGHSILEACKSVQLQQMKFDHPVLVLASGDDHIVNVQATKRWFSNLEAPSKELKIYPKLYHEIFNELESDEPLNVLKDFLLKHSEV